MNKTFKQQRDEAREAVLVAASKLQTMYEASRDERNRKELSHFISTLQYVASWLLQMRLDKE